MAGQTALLLVNAKARQGGEILDVAKGHLASKGFEVLVPEGVGPDSFGKAIRDYKDQIDLVVVGGGDGSIRCAIDGLLSVELPLAVLPLGTANNLARNLGVPGDLAQACDVIASGETRWVDVAEVNGLYFLNVAGIGLSATVNIEVPRELKRKWGVLAYAVTAFKSWRRSRPFRVKIECGGDVLDTHTLQITVCNGRHFGSGLTIAPEASISDGHFDVACIESLEWWQGLRVLRTLWMGRGNHEEGLHRLRGRNVRIHTHRPVWIDTDGDVLLRTNDASFRLHEKALRIFAPPLAETQAPQIAPQTGPKENQAQASSPPRKEPERDAPVEL